MTTIFVHIPRTGGTTFTSLITNNVGGRYLFHFDAANMDFPHLTRQVNHWAPGPDNWISGHVTYNTHTALSHKNYRYITIVRDPVARIWSYFNLLITEMPRPQDKLISLVVKHEANLDKMMDSEEVSDFCNDQSRILLGRDVSNDSAGIKEVIDHVQREYFYAGTTENLNKMIQDVASLYSWTELDIPQTKYPVHPQIAPELAAKIRKYNVVDQALWEFVKERSERQKTDN